MGDCIEVDGLILTDSERNLISELRQRVKELISQEKYEDTYYIYSFLKAGEFDIDQAERNLKECIEYKKQMEVDKILTDYKIAGALQDYITGTRFATAKDGSLVHYIPCGNVDSKGLHRSVKLVDIEKMLLHEIEDDERILLKTRKTKNGPYPGCFWIYDIKNLTFTTATDKKAIHYFYRLTLIYERYYPDRLKAMYFINVHPYFSLSFNVMKVLCSSTTLSKVHLLGDDYKEVLSDMIDKDQLPVFLGGNKTDPDGNPLCKTFIRHGGKIDERFYTRKSKKSLMKSPGVKKLVLSRSSFSEIFIEIEEAGSIIEWEFETKIKDIGFGVFLREFEDEEEKITEMVPLLRLEASECTEVGVYKCEKAGTYIMLFDNSYSWLRSKEIYYKTSVIRPSNVEEQLQNE